MPRMLRRAAVLGTTAHVAANRGQARAEAAAARQAPPPRTAAPEAPASTSEDSYAELMRLKGLLDAGVLTQAEFDQQKHKVLGA
jgi:hypothetical protein